MDARKKKKYYSFLCRTPSSMSSLAFNSSNYWVRLGTFIQASNKDILQGLINIWNTS
ncbi:hypothetical protein MtrunA17_Chr1g0157321 [Medicago truncatula]|uniref:Uncharacterized protein n=1 Tax=Medicago truncatula TaxID=3880 RepID=A0A396JHG8_MEDTR|nr:hypothetical protein MtrunA17_Chr1g0157321 [Medicago truncatula]